MTRGDDAEFTGKRPQRRARRGNTALRDLLADLELWRGEDGIAYATISRGERREHWPVKSEGLEHWLRQRAFARNDPMLSDGDISKIVATLIALAQASGDPIPVWRRVGEFGGNLYIDLGDDTRQVVEIRPAGADSDERWRVVPAGPCRFVRTAGMKALPVPMPGGSVTDFRHWVNVETEAELRLAFVWLLSALRPRGPYPMLVIQGGQGSGKSTLARTLLSLVDPQVAEVRAPPTEERDMAVAARHARVLSFDNLSGMSGSLSDALCRLATGGAFSSRTLHTNDSETILAACCPVIVNGIPDLARRADVADRAVQITARQLREGERKTEDEYWATFACERAALFGVLLDAMSAALAAYEQTATPSGIRMADAARWAEAAAGYFNWPAGEMSAWWRLNRREGDLAVVENDMLASVLVSFLADQPDASWRGTTSGLLEELTRRAPDRVSRSKAWPIAPQGLRTMLDRLRDPLKTAGWTFQREKSNGERLISFERVVAAPGPRA